MECSICLNEICGEKDSRDWNIRSIKLKCGHCFHYSCIQNMGSFNCPACRVNTKYVKLYF